MEFWGVELKGNKPVKVEPSVSQVVHLSQATLAEIKKGSDPITIYAKTGDQKLVIGILSADNFPQLSFDLVFEKEFELSHNSKNGNVHLTGYKSFLPDEDEDDMFSDSEDDEEAPTLVDLQNGAAAAAAAAAKPKPAIVAKKDTKPEEESDDDSEDDDDDSDEDDDESDEVMTAADEDDSDDDDSEEDESDEEEETPVKSVGDKKRPAPATKTPEPKKAKVVTPQKTDGKKNAGGHVATPHPAKNGKSPKSGGQFSSGSKKGGFNSNNNSNKKKGKFGGK